MMSAPIGCSAVALPESSWSRHEKPGAASATALMRSSAPTKSASRGESSGARRRATFICASSNLATEDSAWPTGAVTLAPTEGGAHELEQMDPAGPPLAVDPLHADRHRQPGRVLARQAAGLARVLAAAPAVPPDVQRPVHVLPALRPETESREGRLTQATPRQPSKAVQAAVASSNAPTPRASDALADGCSATQLRTLSPASATAP